jgi:3-phenylpropionate/trans-cinnamate dioxygenase ferredoxin component
VVFHAVARLSELAEDGVLPVALPTGERICLVRCGGVIAALADECTHQAMPLSAGEVQPDGTIECAWHGARFDCRTGAVRQGPAEEAVRTYDVRIEDDKIEVAAQARLERLTD